MCKHTPRAHTHTHTHTHSLSLSLSFKFKTSPHKPNRCSVAPNIVCCLQTSSSTHFHADHHRVLDCQEWLQHFLLETRKPEVSPPLEHAMAKLNNIEKTLFSLTLPLLCLVAKILEPRSNGALDITLLGLTVLPSCPTE